MTDHIPDAGKMVSARDVLAASLWLIDREIAGAPLPHPSWETFRENDPETAMIYETQAGCHLAALSAAGWGVAPREASVSMVGAGVIAALQARKTKPEGMTELGSDLVAGYRAMTAFCDAITAAPEEDEVEKLRAEVAGLETALLAIPGHTELPAHVWETIVLIRERRAALGGTT